MNWFEEILRGKETKNNYLLLYIISAMVD